MVEDKIEEKWVASRKLHEIGLPASSTAGIHRSCGDPVPRLGTTTSVARGYMGERGLASCPKGQKKDQSQGSPAVTPGVSVCSDLTIKRQE
jgi:hypothetical protein